MDVVGYKDDVCRVCMAYARLAFMYAIAGGKVEWRFNGERFNIKVDKLLTGNSWLQYWVLLIILKTEMSLYFMHALSFYFTENTNFNQ
jgi:hypothetical protein